MTHVVTDNCIKCKYMDVSRSVPSTAFMSARTCSSYTSTSVSTAAFAYQSAPPLAKGETPSDADAWNGVPNKLAEHISPKPGDG
jgi:ferredoxin